MKRSCHICQTEIFECMGSVHAGSFVAAMRGETDKVDELCPKCATYYANIEPPEYPQPKTRKSNHADI